MADDLYEDSASLGGTQSEDEQYESEQLEGEQYEDARSEGEHSESQQLEEEQLEGEQRENEQLENEQLEDEQWEDERSRAASGKSTKTRKTKTKLSKPKDPWIFTPRESQLLLSDLGMDKPQEQHLFNELGPDADFADMPAVMKSWYSAQPKMPTTRTHGRMLDKRSALVLAFNDWVRSQAVARGRMRWFNRGDDNAEGSNPVHPIIVEWCEWTDAEKQAFRSSPPAERLLLSNALLPRKGDRPENEVLAVRVLTQTQRAGSGNLEPRTVSTVSFLHRAASVGRILEDNKTLCLMWVADKLVLLPLTRLLDIRYRNDKITANAVSQRVKGGPWWTWRKNGSRSSIQWYFAGRSEQCRKWLAEHAVDGVGGLHRRLQGYFLDDGVRLLVQPLSTVRDAVLCST